MEAKFQARGSRPDGPAFVVAAGAALLLLAVVISAAVVYFIGATLPYAGSPEFGPPPVDPTVSTSDSTAGLAGELPVLTP
ncbi:hypothetical protein [Mycolicibacterium sediminis]|uniref:Uncharacterized protein n=1 Tax=Mycolicibacterium sediminis TaxID=1286180 RepID=A0A7I7QZA3_9MYCO|nr:hypothetical protein [Mycolicibacterium sediminis]BBY31671.1 hypothetical protein MSEDJ_57670 [Mycolicibacterium sediminis]